MAGGSLANLAGVGAESGDLAPAIPIPKPVIFRGGVCSLSFSFILTLNEGRGDRGSTHIFGFLTASGWKKPPFLLLKSSAFAFGLRLLTPRCPPVPVQQDVAPVPRTTGTASADSDSEDRLRRRLAQGPA